MTHSLDAIFRPEAIAVIGASSKKDNIGRVILHNIINGDFQGKVFPVNPNAQVIHSIKSYPSVSEIPDKVDLAIIVVKTELVLPVMEACGQKGVKGAIVITAGFKEVSREGAALEQKVLAVAREYGMRMLGPNCFGAINTDPAVSLNATFAKRAALPGKIGFMSQSGALGETILDYAQKLSLGFSMFASVGNKADISGNDLLEYWDTDSRTQAILLYLENFGNPRRFTEIAQRITKRKPIIAVKAGRTAAGAKAISSHTGVLASIEVGIDAFFDQCGVLRVTTVEELFDLSMAFTNQPLPKGNRVAVITNAGGPGILATDALVSLGLEMANFSNDTIVYLRENLHQAAAVTNPVDVIASGGPRAYRIAVEAVLKDTNVDALLVIFVPPILVDHGAVVHEIVEAIRISDAQKTVLGIFMGLPEGIAGTQEMINHNIPVYDFPEPAAKALAAMVKYREWRAKPSGNIQAFSGRTTAVEKIIHAHQQRGQKTIIGAEALEILNAYQIPVARWERVEKVSDLPTAIHKIGLPMVMKIDHPALVHKTDKGGVIVDIRSEDEVYKNYQRLRQRFADDFQGVMLQEMVRGGVETVMGMHHLPAFGPLMMFGLGGVYVEIMKDVAFKIHPLTDLDAQEMIRSIKGFPLLEGFRGASAVDISFLAEVLLRLNQLVTDFPQIAGFDVNPFIAATKKDSAKAVDARFVLAD